MNILGIIGAFTIGIITIVLLYKLYRHIFGYGWYSCPYNHDTMARNGCKKCPKCGNEL